MSHTVPSDERGSHETRPDPCSKTVPEISESSGSGRVLGVKQGPEWHSVPGAGIRSGPRNSRTGCRM